MMYPDQLRLPWPQTVLHDWAEFAAHDPGQRYVIMYPHGELRGLVAIDLDAARYHVTYLAEETGLPHAGYDSGGRRI